jgi:hypothetical protein
MRAVEVNQGQAATIVWTMTDQLGNPVDLTTCGGGTSFTAVCREITSFDIGSPGTPIPVTAADLANGVIDLALPLVAVAYPGITMVEVGVLTAGGLLLFSNQFYLVVNRGQFGNLAGGGVSNSGPPTLAEIRLHMRDSDPNDNLWLMNYEFDISEIAACIERPILYWNETPPPIPQRYNTSNFPWRYHYLDGIVGCLYSIASIWYARVHLPYQQSGGLQVDDKNKAEIYDRIGKAKWDEYKRWSQMVKVRLNAGNAIQALGSPYSGNYWGYNG